MLTRLTVILGLILCSGIAQATLTKKPFYPEEFYKAYDAGDMQKVKTILKTLVSTNRRTLSYKQARDVIFHNLFMDQNSNVTDVYCHEVHKVDKNTMPSSNVLNVEHTWPQSKFNGNYSRDMQKTDLNILYPTSAKANTSRNNLPFGEVTKDISGPCPSLSRRGYTSKGADLRFEPPEMHKGNVARAIFYFSVQYDLPIDEEQKADLLRWNRLDPVDAMDVERNEKVQSLQGNRNVFIDYPELVDSLIQ